MNLNQVYIPWFLVILTLFAFYTAHQKALGDKGLIGDLSTLLKYLSRFFALVFLVLLVWISYYTNYINSGYANVAKVTLHNCKQTDNCEYIGVVTYRPFTSRLIIRTTPMFPVLNCPDNSCVQKQIFVDKENVKSLKKL